MDMYSRSLPWLEIPLQWLALVLVLFMAMECRRIRPRSSSSVRAAPRLQVLLARSKLGCCCRDGRVVANGKAKGVEWFTLGAEAGNTGAICSNGINHEHGRCVAKDGAAKAGGAEWNSIEEACTFIVAVCSLDCCRDVRTLIKMCVISNH
jgi:hypothetical protein